jgi:hypothetical protein
MPTIVIENTMSFLSAFANRRSGGAFATLVFFAFTAPLGILAHLSAEFAGLGLHDDADVLFSARHGYLAAIALASLIAFAAILLRSSRGSRRERVEAIVSRLPFGGRGPGFVALSFAAQFAFFAITQIGEGCPLCSGDVVTGALAAAFASFVGAVLVAVFKRRVVALAFALAFALSIDDGASAAVARLRDTSSRLHVRVQHCALYVFRNRPPPVRS